jgi:hypothetical protein
MALSFCTVVKAYLDKVKNLPFILNGSFGHSVVGADGLPTKMFFGFLILNHEKGIKFLPECGLLKGDVLSHVRQQHSSLEK